MIPNNIMNFLHDIDIHPLQTFFEYGPHFMVIASLIYTTKPFLFLSFVATNNLVNTILKNVIKEPRPVPTNDYGKLQSYGMPSGHAQIVWFIWLYNMISPYSKYQPIFLTICNTIIAIGTSIQRYYMKKHTILQIIVGFFVGLFLCYTLLTYFL